MIGSRTRIVELLDLYPTLADLCGFQIPSVLEGKSLKPVLTGKKKQVRDHIVTSLGRSTFSIRKKDMKLIRYYDGSEELYNLKTDPNEFHNLAYEPTQAATMGELAELAPIDKRFKQFVRYGQYKAIIDNDNQLKLYDMLHPKSGIGEQYEVSGEKKELVELIRNHLKDNAVESRYYSIEK